MPLWTPVTAPPTDLLLDQRVLLFNPNWNNPTQIGIYEDGEWYDDVYAPLSDPDGESAMPTHWMPLPEPPELSPARQSVITITELDDDTLNVAFEFFPAALANEPSTPSVAAALAAFTAITAAARGEEAI